MSLLFKYEFLWPVLLFVVLSHIPTSSFKKISSSQNAATERGAISAIKSAIKFARLRIVATCYALVFLGSVASGAITLKTLLAFFVVVAATIHANSINDYSDRDIDSINLQNAADRPLVTKDISNKGFWMIHFTSVILVLFFSFFYGMGAVILTMGLLIIDYLYSLKPMRVADRPILSPLLLSAAYVFYSFSIGYWSVSTRGEYPWMLAWGLFLGFVARLLLKDFRDVKGDKQYGKITFLLRYGTKATCLVSGIFWFLAVLVMGQVTSFSPGVFFPLILGFVQVLILLQALSKNQHRNDQETIIAFIAKSANFTIITVLAFLLCQRVPSLSRLEIEAIPAAIGTALLLFNFIGYRNWTRQSFLFS